MTNNMCLAVAHRPGSISIRGAPILEHNQKNRFPTRCDKVMIKLLRFRIPSQMNYKKHPTDVIVVKTFNA